MDPERVKMDPHLCHHRSGGKKFHRLSQTHHPTYHWHVIFWCDIMKVHQILPQRTRQDKNDYSEEHSTFLQWKVAYTCGYLPPASIIYCNHLQTRKKRQNIQNCYNALIMWLNPIPSNIMGHDCIMHYKLTRHNKRNNHHYNILVGGISCVGTRGLVRDIEKGQEQVAAMGGHQVTDVNGWVGLKTLLGNN